MKEKFEIYDRERYFSEKAKFMKTWLDVCAPYEIGRYRTNGQMYKKLNIDYKWDYNVDNDCLPLEIWNNLSTHQREELTEFNKNWFSDFDVLFSIPDDFYKTKEDIFYLFLLIDGKPVSTSGFVLLSDKTAVVHGIETHLNERGKGYAAKLLSNGIKFLKQKGIKKIIARVEENNFRSIAFHSKSFVNTKTENGNKIFEREI